jgi:hypothetical protein
MTLPLVHPVAAAADNLRPCIVKGWFYVPYERLGTPAALAKERALLTFRPRKPGAGPVILYHDNPSKRYLAVPRAYGRERFGHMPTTDLTTDGAAMVGAHEYRRANPDHPSVLEPERQRQFMADMLKAAQEKHEFLAFAGTGTGKTIVAIDTAIQIGRRAFALCPLERIMGQWVEAATEVFGVPRDRIGIVQGPKCEYEGKDLIFGMMHSSAGRNYPPAFYASIGTVIYDETHRIGSPFLAKCAPLFPARRRLGLTATPDRNDGGERIFYWHIGPGLVRSKAVPLPMQVYVRRYRAKSAPGGTNPLTRLKHHMGDADRNALIVRDVVSAYNAGRHFLVVSDGIAHLEALIALTVAAGVPREECGQYTGNYTRPASVGPDGADQPAHRVKTPDAELDRVKEHCRLIFATYGMIKEGIDIPRLDGGLDASYRGDAEQLIGRVRRPLAGKLMPIWVTLVDTRCPYSLKAFAKRTVDYRSTGVEIMDTDA